MTMASSRDVSRHSWSPIAGCWTYTFLFLINAAFVTAACGDDDNGVTFIYPIQGSTFHYLDTINVTYQSNFAHPALYAFCQGTENTKAIQKYKEPNAPGFNASLLVKLTFKSPDDCWFDLKPNTPPNDCGENSQHFTLIQSQASLATIGLDQPSPTATPTAPTNTAAPDIANPTTVGADNGGGGMSTGAQVGLGIGLAVVVGVVAGGLAVFFWQRRRPRPRQDRSSRSIVNHIFRRRQDEKPQPLLPPDWRRSPHTGHRKPWPPSDLPRKQMPTDDAYYVGWSENLPGFYGSARESGSRHDVSAPLAAHHATSGASSLAASSYEGPQRTTPTPSYHTPTPIEYYHSEYYPPEKTIASPARVEESHAASAELPGAHGYRGYGQEFELPTQQQPQPYLPVGRDQEQKFLLDDMELMGLKKQKRQATEQGTSS